MLQEALPEALLDSKLTWLLRLSLLIFGFVVGAAADLQAAIEKRASKDRVLLVHEQDPDLLISELVTRVRGELVAAGFTVDVAQHAEIEDPRLQTEASTAADVVATFVILRDRSKDMLEVWLHDRLTLKTTVRSIRIGAGDHRDHRPGVLAVRVVELLRASLLELISRTATPTAESVQAAPQVTQWVKTAAPQPQRHRGHAVQIEVGLAVLQSWDRVDASLVPRLAAQVRLHGDWSMRVQAAGFGTQPVLEAPAGVAQLQQRVALAEVVWCLPLGTNGCLSLAAGGGAFHLQVEGQTMSPYEAKSPSRWSGAASGGVGLSWALPWHFTIGVRTQAVVLWPHSMVRIAGVDAGRVGLPSLLTGVDVALGF